MDVGACYKAVDQPAMIDDVRHGWLAFTATPAKSGEAVRSFLLKKDCGVSFPRSLMPLFVERLTDVLAVLLLLIINIPLLLRFQLPLSAPIVIGLLVVIAVFVLLFSTFNKYHLKSIVMRFLPRKFANASADSFKVLGLLLQPLLLFKATLIGAAAWILEGVSLWMLLRAMGADQVGIGGATIAHTAAGLFGALTLLPGGIGSTEVGTIILLALQGVGVVVILCNIIDSSDDIIPRL